MSVQKRRYDRNSAVEEGVDHLLRRLKEIDAPPGVSGTRSVPGAGDFPIENTFLVAASGARPEIREVADYVCSGSDDEIEINAALTEANASADGRVVLSAGTFFCDDTVTIPVDVWLQGSGVGATRIQFSDTWAGGSSDGVEVGNGRLSDLNIFRESGD